ncbi:hypothetical protein [Comamonas fluminis]|uniref:hypothetical protein n=1 Tax=Comamonas fluminis TaxID=2796366 RepID=UPI001C44E334|nr:hypothetical protein [Comamonas fluminis]
MTDEQLRSLARQIEALAAGQQPTASLRAFGEVALYANRAGYLQLAAAMLRCAGAEHADIGALFAVDSEFAIDHLALSEAEFDQLSS